MDIFKLGDKILALLEAVFGFWNNQISLVFAMLGQSPVSFKGGGPWAVIEGIEPVFVAVGSSLVVLFFVIGFCSESIDVKDEMRFESIFRMLIRLGLAEWFVANKCHDYEGILYFHRKSGVAYIGWYNNDTCY